jgi:hypothetical protein
MLVVEVVHGLVDIMVRLGVRSLLEHFRHLLSLSMSTKVRRRV